MAQVPVCNKDYERRLSQILFHGAIPNHDSMTSKFEEFSHLQAACAALKGKPLQKICEVTLEDRSDYRYTSTVMHSSTCCTLDEDHKVNRLRLQMSFDVVLNVSTFGLYRTLLNA